MTDALVYRDKGEWWVSLTLLGEQTDLAGPFDDEHDAEMMARRTRAMGAA